MQPATSEKTRIQSVDGLRGLAALAVCWFHFTNAVEHVPQDSLLHASGSYGWLGVEVFFVISGFVLPYSMYSSGYVLKKYFTFLLKRIVRIDPPYLASIVLVLGLSWGLSIARGRPFMQLSLSQLAAHLAYLNAFLKYDWLNPVYWTLAIEFQFYLFIAAAFPLLIHSNVLVRSLTPAAICASSFVFTQDDYLFKYLSIFAMGIVTFQFRLGLLRKELFAAVIVLLAACIVATLGPSFAAAGLLATILIAIDKIPMPRLVLFLGTISYSLYLLHYPIGMRFADLAARNTSNEALQFLALLVSVAITLLCSYGFYRLIEAPAQKWASRLKYRPSAPAQVPGPEQDRALNSGS